MWWARLGSNQGPIGYEPTALTTELRARRKIPFSLDGDILPCAHNSAMEVGMERRLTRGDFDWLSCSEGG